MSITVGEQFEAMTTPVEQVRLDGEAVKELLDKLVRELKITPKDVQACYKTLKYDMLKTNRRDPSLKPKWQAPSVSPNMTPEGIIDLLGETREKIKDLEKTEGFYKEAYQAKIKTAEEADIGTVKEEPGYNL